jgi:anti-sigma regulatory factor (Ser/Thr protein kinase)
VATVELSLSPLPVHVRTARLVGVAAARRAGLADELVDELRLAIGEACSRAVALLAVHAPDEPVRILLRDDLGGLTVDVNACGPASPPVSDDDPAALFGDEEIDPRVSLAVLAGLVDELEITPSESGTTVSLRWPLPPRPV